jgi:hypothetical protein
MKHCKETGRPRALPVKAEPGIPDATASVRVGLAQALRGEGRLADEIFDELEREDVPR